MSALTATPSPTGGRSVFSSGRREGCGLFVATSADFHMATGKNSCSEPSANRLSDSGQMLGPL